jgi:tricorn protease
MSFRRVAVLVSLSFVSLSLLAADATPPKLFQRPALSRDSVAFAHAGDIWIAGRNGGEARRLTSSPGSESNPRFSPDGSWLAFNGTYDGNTDVYVVSAGGGIPRRLTWHPSSDTVAGWTPDGKRILFVSNRASYSRFSRLFTVPVDGGMAEEIPLPQAFEGSYSADGSRIAYVPYPGAFQTWKRYRGGEASPIWLAKLSDSSVEAIVPRNGSNDFSPMWVGDSVYFLSDREGPTTLYVYDTKSKAVTRAVDNKGLDVKSASAGPGGIVYDQFDAVHLYDTATHTAKRLDIRVNGELPDVRPRFVNVSKSVATAHLSPAGVRAVFEARGEILTVPAEKGDIRDVTNTPGVAERDPAWSPDGQKIAYFSDESGEYELHVRAQNGMGAVQKIGLGTPPSFFYDPLWSPDGKKIAYTDKRLNLWYIDLDHPEPVKVDTDYYDLPWRQMNPSWSPDSKWLAYVRQLPNHFGAVFFHSLESKKSTQITDGLSDAQFPRFDRNGKYLYFVASTDVATTLAWLDMSSIGRTVSRSAYVIVLDKTLPSPLAPQSDDEKAAAADKKSEEKPADVEAAKTKADAKEAKKDTRIDLDGIAQRVLALPVPARNYQAVYAGKTGIVYFAEGDPVQLSAGEGDAELVIQRFDLDKRKAEKFVDGVSTNSNGGSTFDVSANGEKVLFRKGDTWFISAGDKVAAGEGALKTSGLEVYVDPRAEWRQEFNETLRIERDFFYDPKLHGLDLATVKSRYEPYVAGLGSRGELTALFSEMWGGLTVGHLYISGPANDDRKVSVGLLGADYTIDSGRYRFARVYDGENWNPQLKAPLTQPGVNVKAGEYLLSVNGREVRPPDEVHRFLEATAGKSVVLRVGPNANGDGAREVTVVPVASESGLRNLAWIESNRRKTDELSKGRVAYVYMANTAGRGFTDFNRYFFAQAGREGLVLDERFNGGGDAADYAINMLQRPLMSYWATREGNNFSTPLGGIFGPKAMIINAEAGSGGDAMPWYFRQAKLGPLVGTRTWGGLVGIYSEPDLIDGGHITAPRLAFFTPGGEWDVENHGVDPDVEVEMDPKAWRDGHDPQLEKAVEVVLDELAKSPVPGPKMPAYPNKQTVK